MSRILFIAFILLSSVVRADETPSPATDQATDQTTDQAPTEQKSFFESRTLEDLQQLVHVDAKSLQETNSEASSQGAG